MYFFNMFYHVTTSRFTSFTHVFHKKRKGQEVQKSASSLCHFSKNLTAFLLFESPDTFAHVDKVFLIRQIFS